MIPDGEQNEMFRAGVGLVIADGGNRVLVFERSDVAGAWQLPQGGLDPGEAEEAAAWRELGEETGLAAGDVTLDAVSDFVTRYELPEEMRSAKTGRGQVHRWFLFRLREGVELPPLPAGPEAEFRNRKWTTLSEVTNLAVSFRRPVYETVARWIGGGP